MIPASELAAMRATASSALDISGVQIQRKSTTDNGDGTFGVTWSTIATVAATEAKPSASVMQQYSGVIGTATVWTLRLPYGTAYRADDRILMPSGETRRIQADLSDSSYSTCALLLVARIEPGG